MTERFDDYISQGKSENQAYSLVISNLGDVDEMLAEVMPDADFVSQARSYRRRNARNTAISVAIRLDKPILLKRGLSSTIEELLMSAEYIMAGGNEKVILCERGIRTYETYTRNTLDISAVPILKKLSRCV